MGIVHKAIGPSHHEIDGEQEFGQVPCPVTGSIEKVPYHHGVKDQKPPGEKQKAYDDPCPFINCVYRFPDLVQGILQIRKPPLP